MNRFSFLHFPHTVLSKMMTCIGLAVSADFLLYGHVDGWVAGLFGLLLLAAVALYQRQSVITPFGKLLLVAAGGLTLAMIEEPTHLSVLMFSITTVAFSILRKLDRVDDARLLLDAVMRYLIYGWLRFFQDGMVMLAVRKRLQKARYSPYAWVLRWVLPVGCSLVFILLFSTANPLISQWLGYINLDFLRKVFSLPRISFWLVMIAGSWALLRPKLRMQIPCVKPALPSSSSITELLFNTRAIRTSLILFNALFLMQNIMDIAFLWSGAALPDGMSYAGYAHRGAYPLIVTALLSAAFILIAFDAGSKPALFVRLLVYGWVGQNLFLVLSSAERLHGYIEEYSLTQLRISAFIWMGLVALGLMLIVARIVRHQTNRWLINCNLGALYATLYLCCFVNFGSIIANYNVVHSHEVSGQGIGLDINYLETRVGVASIPALIWFEQHYPQHPRTAEVTQGRKFLQAQLFAERGWRAWTFRDYRIARIAPKHDDFDAYFHLVPYNSNINHSFLQGQ